MFGVGFDFDHTLGIDNRLERTALLNVLDRNVVTTPAEETRWGEMVDGALHTYRQGQASLNDAMIRLFVGICGPSYDHAALFDAFVEETMRLAPAHIEAITGARELLQRLEAARIPTAILTNGWNPLQQRKADLIGYAGPVIVSDDLEIRKPDAGAFKALAAALELPASQIIYVGDTPEIDIRGAIGAGMQALWFDWEGRSFDPALPAPTAVIHALADVDAFVFAGRR